MENELEAKKEVSRKVPFKASSREGSPQNLSKGSPRKVCLHRVEIPETMKSTAVLAADIAMDKYSIEKVECTSQILINN